MQICEWMTLQNDIELTPGDYAVHLDLIAKIRGINSAEKFFEDLPDKMRGQPTCTALLHTYAQHKASSKAEALMEKMSECGFLKYPLPYNHMMTLYISTGQLEKVPGIIRELKKNTSPDIVTYNLWLRVCASLGDIERAEKILLELKKAKVDPDWVTFSTLTGMYTKKSLHEKAVTTLKEMEKRVSRKVRIAYASVISLHTGLGNKDDVYRVWEKMKSLFRKMNDAEYISMISSLVKLKELTEAEKLHTEWESVSTTGDTRVPNLILAAYINKNEMQKAENFFQTRMVDKGIVPSYITWEILTWGYIKQKQMDKVLDCFKKGVGCFKRKKWEFNEKLVGEVYGILEENGNIEGAEQLLVTLRKAGHVNTKIYNMLLRTYAGAEKMPLVIAERMKKDKVEMDEETHELIKKTSKMCVSEVIMGENV